MIRAALAFLLVAAPAAAAPDGRLVATPADRERLGRWREAWVAALGDARRSGAVAATETADALFDYDRRLPDPLPPEGAYRCRTVKLGARSAGMLAHVTYPFFACRIAREGGALRLTKLTGSQRQVGVIYPRDAERAVFLGTLMYGYEKRALPYGRDRSRDVAGWIERIGARRWRLAMPYPAYESMLDVMELEPAE